MDIFKLLAGVIMALSGASAVSAMAAGAGSMLSGAQNSREQETMARLRREQAIHSAWRRLMDEQKPMTQEETEICERFARYRADRTKAATAEHAAKAEEAHAELVRSWPNPLEALVWSLSKEEAARLAAALRKRQT